MIYKIEEPCWNDIDKSNVHFQFSDAPLSQVNISESGMTKVNYLMYQSKVLRKKNYSVLIRTTPISI
jgi:hypothetical protein